MSLDTLITRFEAAQGADRKLDDAIARAISGSSEHWHEVLGVYMTPHNVPAYTASLDAIVSLIERALPGAIGELDWTGDRPEATIWVEGYMIEAIAATKALALCLAFCRALRAIKGKETP